MNQSSPDFSLPIKPSSAQIPGLVENEAAMTQMKALRVNILNFPPFFAYRTSGSWSCEPRGHESDDLGQAGDPDFFSVSLAQLQSTFTALAAFMAV
jgi:hypothetical protein